MARDETGGGGLPDPSWQTPCCRSPPARRGCRGESAAQFWAAPLRVCSTRTRQHRTPDRDAAVLRGRARSTIAHRVGRPCRPPLPHQADRVHELPYILPPRHVRSDVVQLASATSSSALDLAMSRRYLQGACSLLL